MKKVLLLITLLCLVCFVACKRTETTENLSGVNSKPQSLAASGDTGKAADKPDEAAPQTKKRLPPPTGYVNDYAKVVDDATKARLEKMLAALKERAVVEFAVVTVETTGEEDIFDYSLAVAREWGIGIPPKNDGLLLFVAVRDRKWRIQVSRHLEADLPDEVVGEFGRLMTGPFRKAQYGEGLTKCVEAIIGRLSERRAFKLNEVILPQQQEQARPRS